MTVMHRLAVLALAAIILWTPALAADQRFLTEVDDLPLAPGLVELPGGTLFDLPQGRIVEASAQGTMLEVEARSFYDETLPELGWQIVADDQYRRDKEILRIEYSEGLPMTVHFSLTPARNAAAKDGKNGKDDKDSKEDKGGKVDQDDKGAQ